MSVKSANTSMTLRRKFVYTPEINSMEEGDVPDPDESQSDSEESDDDADLE